MDYDGQEQETPSATGRSTRRARWRPARSRSCSRTTIIPHINPTIATEIITANSPGTGLAMATDTHKNLLEADADVQDPSDFPPHHIAPGLRQLDDALRCSICRELYDAPVMLPCGHCFCSLVRTPT